MSHVKGQYGDGNSELRDETDFYETPRGFVRALLDEESFGQLIWEPSAGKRAIADVLEERGHTVICTDIRPQAKGVLKGDFLVDPPPEGEYDIVMNPPFSHLNDFVEKAVKLSHQKMATVMAVNGLCSRGRYERIWTKLPIKKILFSPMNQKISSNRGIIPSHFAHIWAIFDKGYSGPVLFEWTPCVTYDGSKP